MNDEWKTGIPFFHSSFIIPHSSFIGAMSSTALMDSLRIVRRRVRVLGVLYGVGIAVSAAIGLFLAIVFIDYLLNLAPIPRIALSVAALWTMAYVLAKWVIAPALGKLGLSDVAGRLEDAFPQFDDRLRSTVEFLTTPTPGSQVMKDRTASQAEEMAQRLDLRRAIQTRPVWQSFAAAGGSIAIVVLLGLLLGSEYLMPALTRIFTPFDGRPWPKRVQIEMVADLPPRIPAGSSIDVRIRLTKGDKASRQARVFTDYGDGRIEQEIMTRGEGGVYTASLDTPAKGNVKVWISSGDDSTQPKTIEVIPRLAIQNIQLIVTPPPYAQLPPYTIPLDTGPATVTYGSNLSLQVTFNKTLDADKPVTLVGETGQLPAVQWQTPQGSIVIGNWIARSSSSFAVHATDMDGFGNADATQSQIIVRPDQLPTIQITQPARDQQCTPQAVIPLRAVAEDDYAIQSLKLVIAKIVDKPQPLATIDLVTNGQPQAGVNWDLQDSTVGQRRWQMDFAWDLSKLPGPPKAGDTLEYHLEAQDNFSFEGQTHPPVSSGRYRVTILSQEQFSAMMNDLMGQIRQQIVEVRNTQMSLKDQTADLNHDTSKQTKLTDADRIQAQSLVASQSTAAAQTKQAAAKLDELAREMDQNKSTAADLRSIASDVRDDLNNIAEHPMKDAAAQISSAQESNPQDRDNQLASAQDNQQQAAEKLDQDAARIGQAGGLPKAIEELRAILAEQHQISQKSDEIGLKNLGKRPDQMDAQDRQAQQQNADRQAALAQQMQKSIDQMSADAQKMQKTDPASAQAMQQAARAGEQQQVAGQMQASSDAQKQNQQSAAQQAQAQAEVGLQMMLRELEEAQKRKLEELSRQLADMQQQIQNLIREQAQLNYENLSLQGGDVLKKTDGKIIDDLLNKAQWMADSVPPIPDLQSQTRLQEQTERNTRSVGKAAQALPEGANIMTGLDRAAQRMGRAITSLRDDSQPDGARLSGAYDPPQVEALAALQRVKEIVDEQARANDEALNQKKKDSIRAAFEKILTAQKKIDGQTQQIDKAPRDADGQLGHRDSILLGQLPAQQGDLATTTEKLEADLTTLGGIVYVWANRDIVDSMREVKTDLAQPNTGAVTQAEQQRIEDQLTAMIDSLKAKPKQSQFASPRNPSGGSSGGQGGPPPLPPEAELRLLKQLQLAVNKSTTTINDQGNPQEPALVALGQRQAKLRNLLDELLQNSSHGKVKLAPEPSPTDKLPEEASDDSIDDQELQQSLLKGDAQPTSDQEKDAVAMAGQRMGRSHQRLSDDHDPGHTTQEIQKRILKNLDDLIEMARAQQSQSQSSPSSGQSGQASASDPNNAQQPQNGNGQSQGNPTQNGTSPAQLAARGHDVDTTGTPTQDITQSLKEWGALSPRKRAAVIEAASEKPIDKFKSFIDDYYRALGTRAGEQ
jgi:hypothetical protein